MASLADQTASYLKGAGQLDVMSFPAAFNAGAFSTSPAQGVTGHGNVAPPSITDSIGNSYDSGLSKLWGTFMSDPLDSLYNSVSGGLDKLFGGSDAAPASADGVAKSAGIFDQAFWTALFIRGTVIVTGMIFIAAALAMFNGHEFIEDGGPISKKLSKIKVKV